MVGLGVGFLVGPGDGRKVGLKVGSLDGENVGGVVGFRVGARVGGGALSTTATSVTNTIKTRRQIIISSHA